MDAAPDLTGRCYIVTGASGGLGAAMVSGLLAAGAAVVAGDLSPPDDAWASTVGAAAQDRLHLRDLDVCDDGQVDAAVAAALDRFGRLDGIVNNAGIGQDRVSQRYLAEPPPFWTVPPDLWRRMMAVNATGPFLLARAAAPVLIAQGWGRIVNITTSLGTMLRRGMAPYAGSKAAAEAHTVTMAQDLQGSGVTANVLVPGGPVDTPMVPSFGLDRAALLRADIMVPPLLWLLSDRSDGVTGRRFVAARWDDTLGWREAADRAGAPAGWPLPDDGHAILPAGADVAD